jgi:competence protein ComEC
MTVAFLSVGQGDAAVIRTPSGKTVLVDAGPAETSRGGFDAGQKVVVPYLRRQGVNSIDAFVISHPHEDHIGGAEAVLYNFKVKTVLDSGLAQPVGPYRELLGRIRDSHITYRKVRRGHVIDLHDGVVIEVLAPRAGESTPEGDSGVNNTSVILRVRYGKTRVLFAGDAEEEEEEEMLASGEAVMSDVLKIPHHGSAQGTNTEWLAAIGPKVAVISVGWRNQFGHPAKSVLQRLQDAGIDTYRTDRNGTVTISTDGSRISVSTAR